MRVEYPSARGESSHAAVIAPDGTIEAVWGTTAAVHQKRRPGADIKGQRLTDPFSPRVFVGTPSHCWR